MVGEDLTHQLRLGELHEEAVARRRVHLEGVAEAELPGRQPRTEGELLVDELAREHRVGRLDGIIGRQVVVFPRVDDDAGVRVDHAREVLVDERPLRVDVAEEDAVERIVEHHVEPLERAHRRDLRHAEAAAVVG